MSDRSHNLKAIRPIISSALVTENMSVNERFQNITLRPLIKLQNDLLISAFRNYIVKRKNVFHELNLQERMDYIAHAVQKDLKLRNSLKGMIIGQFTVEEYELYILDSSALNKRMMNMVIGRLKDQMQLLEQALSIQ